MATTPRADSMEINIIDLTPPHPSAPERNYVPSPMHIAERKKSKQMLQRAAMKGDWELAEDIFHRYPDLMTERLDFIEGMTALLLAANCGRSEFVEKLVNILEKEQLSKMKDQVGRNVLHHAAQASDLSTAKAIVKKNPELVQAEEQFHFTPMFYAARWRFPLERKDMLEYLYTETDHKVYKDPTAPSLIVAITSSECYDIALRILKLYPNLALAKNFDKWSILHVLATQPDSSRSESSSLSSWGDFKARKQQRQRQKDARELVIFVCQQLLSFEDIDVMDYFLPNDFEAILHLATENGASDLVELCLNFFPSLIWYTSKLDSRLLLHVAIEYRRIEIYNLITHMIGDNAGPYASTKLNANNILHLAAYLAPTPRLFSDPGPAFQMQRELQWFKAVESIIYRVERHQKNSERFTPEELFYESHRKLLKEAKVWMKDISNSCMVVAALVATVAFASMITMPGGSNDTGMPILSNQKLFAVFSVANALSMISSAIALLLFLSIQTSRHTEKDFLKSLPHNLFKGLLALFVAVATMMIAFGTAIGLALETRLKWVYIPITVVACIPAIIFTWLHLPLLTQTLKVESGPLIFGQRNPKKEYLDKIGKFLVRPKSWVD